MTNEQKFITLHLTYKFIEYLNQLINKYDEKDLKNAIEAYTKKLSDFINTTLSKEIKNDWRRNYQNI